MRQVSTERLGEFNNDLYYSAMRILLSSASASKVHNAWHDSCDSSVVCRHWRYCARSTVATQTFGTTRTRPWPRSVRRWPKCSPRLSRTLRVRTYLCMKDVEDTVCLVCLDRLPKTLDDCRMDDGTLRSWIAASEVGISFGTSRPEPSVKAGIAVAAATGYPCHRKRKRALKVAGTRGYRWVDPKEQQKQFRSSTTTTDPDRRCTAHSCVQFSVESLLDARFAGGVVEGCLDEASVRDHAASVVAVDARRFLDATSRPRRAVWTACPARDLRLDDGAQPGVSRILSTHLHLAHRGCLPPTGSR